MTNLTESQEVRYIKSIHLALQSIPDLVPPKFAEVMTAQFALETGFGKSDLAKYDHNHAGIKVGKTWKGKQSPTGVYRKYDSFQHFVEDYIRVISTMPWFEDAWNSEGGMDFVNKLVNPDEPVWATDPDYVSKVGNILGRYSKAFNDSRIKDSSTVESDSESLESYVLELRQRSDQLVLEAKLLSELAYKIHTKI